MVDVFLYKGKRTSLFLCFTQWNSFFIGMEMFSLMQFGFVFVKHLNSTLLHLGILFVCFQICSPLKHLILVSLQPRNLTGINFSLRAMMEVSLKLPLFPENERKTREEIPVWVTSKPENNFMLLNLSILKAREVI